MWRNDFPLIRNWQEVYLDSAATTQKPEAVIRTLTDLYESCNANVHRSPHRLGREMTELYEGARSRLSAFFGAGDDHCLIFTRGATESVNLVASSALPLLFSRDPKRREVVVTAAEHHSNFVPWQQQCRRLGGTLKVVPVDAEGMPDMKAFSAALSGRTALVAFAHLTNVFGRVFPAEEMAELCHRVGAAVLVDGAQAAGHLPVSLEELGCDFYCASGHKMYGPNGIGLLFGKRELLETMEPWQFGGEMVDRVYEDCTLFAEIPAKFEAGTPDYIQAAGLAAAADYLDHLGGMEAVAKRERALTARLAEGLRERKGILLPASPEASCGIVSFLADGLHPFDAAALLDAQGIETRCGFHCAQPLMRSLGLSEGTVRISLGLYNTQEDLDRLFAALDRIVGRGRS